jgi:predicted metalloprotease with PDZ domain
VVCFLLDVHVRYLTDNQRSLDDVLRLLWQRVQKGETLSERAFEAAAVQVACAPLETFFNRALRSTEELDFACLQHLGLEVSHASSAPTNAPWLCLGMYLQGSLVTHVRAPGAACQAGIQPGDELLALDEHKWNSPLLPQLMEGLLGRAPLKLHYFRRGRLCQTQIIPEPAPLELCRLRHVDNPSPLQERALHAWLKGSRENAHGN